MRKVLICFTVISLLFCFPLVSSAAEEDTTIYTNLYLFDLYPDVTDTSLGDQVIGMDGSTFTFPYTDTIVYSRLIISIHETRGTTIDVYSSSSQLQKTIYTDGEWLTPYYRGIQFDSTFTATPTEYEVFNDIAQVKPTYLSNRSFFIYPYTEIPDLYIGSTLNVDGTFSYESTGHGDTFNSLEFDSVNQINYFDPIDNYNHYILLVDSGVTINFSLQSEFSNANNFFFFFTQMVDYNPPDDPDDPDDPPYDPNVDDFFSNLFSKPFEILDSLTLYVTQNGYRVTLWGVLQSLIVLSIIIWILKLIAGG